MTEQKQQYLNKAAESIQPNVDIARRCLPQDVELYTSMSGLYDALCERKISFSLFFTGQETGETYLFYRMTELLDQKQWQKITNSQMAKMYSFLCSAGFIKHLENHGYLTLTEKGQHKTFEDKMNEDLAKQNNENLRNN